MALATVADVMALHGENRRLVRAGLAALANTAKPGLRALMAVSRADPSALDTYALGFRLGPRINAAGRLRRADAGLELLLTDDERRAREIAAELDAVNIERRAVERQILWEAQSEVASMGTRSAYVLAAEDWHPGVIGIVASRIAERYHRPAILIALDGELGTGSGRSIPGFDLLGALHASAAQLERYGGHRAAAGLTVRRDRLEELRDAIERHAESVLTEDLLHPLERIDAIVSGTELGLGFAEELRALEPCGMGNPQPKLMVPGARFEDPRPMGEDGKHLRFTVTSGGTRARAVSFGCDGRLGVEARTPVDATFRLERNVWNGAVEPRLLLRHARPCAPPAIEVLGESEDYLAIDAGRARARAGAGGGRDRRRAGRVRRSRRVAAHERHARPARGERARSAGRRALCRRTGAGGMRGRAAAADRIERTRRRICADLVSRARAPVRDRGRIRADRGPGPAVVQRPGRPSCTSSVRLPTWRGAHLSYALRSRCTSSSTVCVLRSWLSTEVFGPGRGWPVRSSSTCFAAMGRMVVRHGWRPGWSRCSRSWSSSASTGICRPWRSPGQRPPRWSALRRTGRMQRDTRTDDDS